MLLDGKSASRVLVYRLGSLGDTVVALPALHLIARSFPNAERALLTNLPVGSKTSAAAAVLGESGLIDRYFYYPASTRDPLVLWRLARTLSAWKPEVLVYLHPSRGAANVVRDAVFFGLCGIRRFVGLPLGSVAAPLLDSNGGIWEGEWHRLLRSLRRLGEIDAEDPGSWDLHLNEGECAAAGQSLAPLRGAPYIACGVGAKVQAKDWGADNWRALLDGISELLPGYGLVLVGAADERDRGKRVSVGWPGRVVNLCGATSPRVSAHVLAGASMFLGHDGGPMHLAALSGTPCVAIFAAVARPGQWFPYGRHHRVLYHRTDCFNCGLNVCLKNAKKCILSIQVDEVFDAVADLVSSGGLKRKAGIPAGDPR